ncbi:MAG: UvrD-helicase domain-containing protein [Tannerellaceae bacterium]|nr:UvrD-helicase domain-containing protein [Tannerellaceae bacterium]
MIRSLSENQKAILDCEDNRIIIKACPGSGKTFTVSAKLSKLLRENRLFRHQGIAAISFTNTACRQIINSLKEDFNISTINYPHFIGTIDSFINNYIFLPYGHLVMKCKTRPEIAGTEYNQWFDYDYSLTKRFKNQIVFRDPNCYFDKVSFDINGNLLRLLPYQSYHFGKSDWEQQKNQERRFKESN